MRNPQFVDPLWVYIQHRRYLAGGHQCCHVHFFVVSIRCVETLASLSLDRPPVSETSAPGRWRTGEAALAENAPNLGCLPIPLVVALALGRSTGRAIGYVAVVLHDGQALFDRFLAVSFAWQRIRLRGGVRWNER